MGKARIGRGGAVLLAATLAAALLVVSCTPVPALPSWSSANWPHVDSPAALVDRAGAWTDGTWFATVRTTTVGGSPTKSLEITKRAASDPIVLAPSQQIPLPEIADFVVVGESFLGVQVGQTVQFFRPDSAGVWSPAGTVGLPVGALLADLTDNWMALRVPADQFSFAAVQMYSVDATGATITADYVTTLQSSSTSFCQYSSFGSKGVKLDGELLAVGVGSGLCSPSNVRSVDLFRLVGGVWQLAQQFAATSGLVGYAASFDVDDQTTVDRLVIGSQLGVYQQAGVSPQVEVFEDTGSGFSVVATVVPDPSVPPYLASSFGSQVALSGRVLGVTSKVESYPSAESGQPDVRGQYVAAYFRSTTGTWSLEAEKAAFVNPAPAGTLGSVPVLMMAARSTIAVANLVPLTQAPCVGCYSQGEEAWFFDRSPA